MNKKGIAYKTLTATLVLCLVGIAIGILIFLVRKTQVVDNVQHLARLNNIRTVDALDVGMNRAVTQVGVSTEVNETGLRATTTARLGEALDALETGSAVTPTSALPIELPIELPPQLAAWLAHFSPPSQPAGLRGLTPQIDHALDQFLDTVESKFELAFDFEAQNVRTHQRLIAAMTAVADLGTQILAAAPVDQRTALTSLLGSLNTEITLHGVTQNPENQSTIESLLDQIDAVIGLDAEDTDSSLAADARLLRTRSHDVTSDKAELVARITHFLSQPTAEQLQQLEQAYTRWHSEQTAIANQYRLWLSLYAALLLLGLGLVGLRLRRSYRDLDRANAKLQQANETLESQVIARTRDLSRALDELKASQAQLIQSEKMASLGQMVAGVAHEINTPLGYARSNAEIVRTSLHEIRTLVDAQGLSLDLMTRDDASDAAIAEALAAAQTLSHELEPATLMDELDNLLGDTDHGLQQIAELVSSLKDFSRVDRSRHDLFDVNDGIDSALKIAHNQLKHHVEIVKNYGQLPAIECSPSQLNQVFLNLINNAAQAMDDGGSITIETLAQTDGVHIRFTDTGCGMDQATIQRIFEPFFTTKPVGKGTGLGMSIVFRIIEDHGGTIDVDSTPGQGTTFTIRLPLKQSSAPASPTPTD